MAMHHKDKRFARDLRFRFFCLNTDQRHDAASKCSIFANKRHYTSILELAECLEREPSLIKNFLAFANIRGTLSYWCQRLFELETMVNQIGLPTPFFILSAADLWWPMHRLLRVDAGSFDSEKSLTAHMQKLLKDNPQIPYEYFAKRVEIFMKFVSEHLDVTGYWHRFEWQHRWSALVYFLIWIRNAPDVRTLASCTLDEINSHRLLFDTIVCAINLNVNSLSAIRHTSREMCTNVDCNDPIPVAELMNRVQRHHKLPRKLVPSNTEWKNLQVLLFYKNSKVNPKIV